MPETDKDITVLNRKRGYLKGQLTKLSSELAEKQEKLNIAQLESELTIVAGIGNKFELVKDDYFKIATEKELTDVEPALRQIDEDLQKLEVSLKTSINKIKYNKHSNVDSSTHDSYATNSDQPKKALIKLPKIPLPTFSGKFEEWNLFKSQFNSLINENSDLSENEKLHYLRGSLRGDAKIIETADDNFCSLFEALQKRYENKRVIVDCHVKNILNMQPIKHESGKDLRYLTDNIKKNLRSLKVLEFNRDKLSDIMLLNIILDKLDRETRKQYELTLKDNEVPNFDTFLEFLERRCQILNSIHTNIPTKFHPERSKSLFVKSNKIVPKICVACKNETHALYHCSKFREMKLSERLDLVKKYRLCFNCLSEFHLLSECNSKSSCFVCKRKFDHHTLLHKYVSPDRKGSGAANLSPSTPQHTTASDISQTLENTRVNLFTNGNNKSVLINTAIIYVKDSSNIKRPLRAILDCASESSFITSHAASVLGLKKEKINIPVSGLNNLLLNIKSKVSAHVSSGWDDSHWEIDFLIVPKIADFTPSKLINVSQLNIPRNIKLADPTFFIPQRVDILLGAELFFALLRADKINLGDNLFLQSSIFGYLVSGVVANPDFDKTAKQCFLSRNLEDLDKTLTNFWEIEEVENRKNCNDDELNYCNEHFAKTHFRKPDGRYVVTMPFKPELSANLLGNSKQIASKRLGQLWTRLDRDPDMKTLYTEFLKEYELSNHMEEIKHDANIDDGYYLPHHGVLRPTSKTTKLRVVFNASAKTTSGFSLNDLLCKGGVLQEDLFSILIRFRKHIYAFTADIKQMFRMIEINPSQCNLQKILWKDDQISPTKIYQLRTVTYGTACAPYLATKVLEQLAKDEKRDFPLAASVLLQDFYMDDCLSGSSEETEFKKLQLELTQLLRRGGMTLHKCRTNKVPTPTLQDFSLDRNSEEIAAKTLGLLWNNSSDSFTYKVHIGSSHNYTKREVLSQIARIYDPLGLLGPVIAKAKIFMQQLWLLKLDWNEILPPDISNQWENFIKTLPHLESIQVSRCFLEVDLKSVVIHGFADASSKAYGAVIYVQTVSNSNKSNSKLLCSKSRVAPIKLITIPRLELSACLLLAKLIQKVLSALKMQINSVKLWSDSTIALAWINTPSSQLKTFVGNRVSQIQHLSKDFQWQHVPSEWNPADLVSRGLDVKSLTASELWWKGPNLLELNELTSTTSQKSSALSEKLYIDELKTISRPTLTLKLHVNFFDNLLDLTNNFSKLIRVLAFVFRFIAN